MFKKEDFEDLLWNFKNEPCYIDGVFVKRLINPQYSEYIRISEGWTSFGCPGGFKSKSENKYISFDDNPPTDIGSGIFFSLLDPSLNKIEDGILYSREIIGWLDEKIVEPIQSNFLGVYHIPHKGKWMPFSSIDFIELKERLSKSITNYNAPNEEEIIVKIALMLNDI